MVVADTTRMVTAVGEASWSDANSGERPPDDEVPLVGGIANLGSVRRSGDAVIRRIGTQSAGVHAFLAHLHEAGIDFVPELLACVDGEEVLTYLPGRTAADGLSAAMVAPQAVHRIASLQRQLHAAAADFTWPDGVTSAVPYLPDGTPNDLVCHNDLNCNNVVFVGDTPTGFIDFDYAGPTSRLFDIAYMARHWVPFRDPQDLEPEWLDSTQIERFHAIVDAHALTAAEANQVIEIGAAFLDTVLGVVRQRAEADVGGFRAMWRAGYETANRRAAAWLRSNGPGLISPPVVSRS